MQSLMILGSRNVDGPDGALRERHRARGWPSTASLPNWSSCPPSNWSGAASATRTAGACAGGRDDASSRMISRR